MKREIPLSTIEFFTQGNVMIGSVTPDEMVADPLANLFQYRAFADGDKLAALCYVDNRCYELTDKAKVMRNDFELSPDGIDAAAAWLEARSREYMRSLGHDA